MKIGISLSNYGPMPSRSFLKEAVIEIEDLGLDSIWVSDHIIVPKTDKPWNRVFESITTLGFLASITESVNLGSSIILVPLRDPMVLAKQIATLDALSNGRIIVGVGVGWNKKEFELLGYDFEKRNTDIVKKVQIMRKMWANEYSQQGYSCEPLPTSKLGPPILIGGQSNAALKRVIKFGDGWHPVGISAQQYASGIKQIEESSKKDFLRSLRINFAANQKIDSQYKGADGSPRLRLVGNTDKIISKIQEYQQAGVYHMVCDIRADSEKQYFEQLKIVGEIKNSF